jgi:hypothetical protein
MWTVSYHGTANWETKREKQGFSRNGRALEVSHMFILCLANMDMAFILANLE